MSKEIETEYTEFPNDTRLKSFIDWLNQRLTSIPEDYRHTASISILAVMDEYGAYYMPAITISHSRPETEEEIKEKATKEKQARQLQFAQDLQTIERLAKKHKVTVETRGDITTLTIGSIE